jgi:hypothetical protein
VEPGVCWAMIVMAGEGEEEVERVRAVWRPVTPAPRIVMNFGAWEDVMLVMGG